MNDKTEWVMVPRRPTMAMKSAALDMSRKYTEEECPLPRCKELWASAQVWSAWRGPSALRRMVKMRVQS